MQTLNHIQPNKNMIPVYYEEPNKQYINLGKSLSGNCSIEKFRLLYRLIFSDKNTKNIFLFLLLNLTFAVNELYYGLSVFSFHLIRDSFHTIFDCIGYFIALYASITVKYKADDKFSFGYGRAEILAGFTNGTFLIFIVLYNIRDVIHRNLNHSETKGEISFFTFTLTGIFINLIGLKMFQIGYICRNLIICPLYNRCDEIKKNYSQITKSVSLHVLADTLLRSSKIISESLDLTFGWTSADFVCTLCVLTIITMSVYDLMYETCTTLMERRPNILDATLKQSNQKVHQLAGVQRIQEQRFWTLSSGVFVGTMQLDVTKCADPKYIVSHTQMIFSSAGCRLLYVQLQFLPESSSSI